MTLIDKLNKHKETITVLRGTEEQGSHEFIFLGHHLLGLQTAIDIVKEEHKCIWKGVYIYHRESTCYALSCGNEYFDNYMGEDVDIFKYCPYCGGEIKLDGGDK